MSPGQTGLFHLQDPENVKWTGHDMGGPLKLYHRTDRDNALPGEFEHIIIKWPAYTQWTGRGERAANPTEYWLCQVVERIGEGRAERWRLECVAAITPGRQRKPVQALVAQCDRLAMKDEGDDEPLDTPGTRIEVDDEKLGGTWVKLDWLGNETLRRDWCNVRTGAIVHVSHLTGVPGWRFERD